MVERIEWMTENLETLDTSTTARNMMEEWDNDQGRAIQHSERQLSRTQKPYQWSPTLRNAGLLYRYWRLCHWEATTGTANYSNIYDRMLRQTATHDPTFRLPYLGERLTLDIIITNLNSADKHLKKSQNESVELRYKCCNDLLAYKSDQKPRHHGNIKTQVQNS